MKNRSEICCWSSGKDKQRITLVVTIASNGEMLPPFVILKVSKPRNKAFSDIPPNKIPKFDADTDKMLKRIGAAVVNTYSGWMNKQIMEKYYIPYFKANTKHDESLLIFDNHAAHVCNATIAALEENEIEYLNLVPNTTPICQPMDVMVGASLKGKIKRYFEDWLIENEETIITFDEKKKKGRFTSPDKVMILEWIWKGYREMGKKLIMESNFFVDFLLKC